MKSKTSTASRVLALLLASWIGMASAQITIVNDERGFLGSDKTQITTADNGGTEVSFDATGANKLVIVIASEPGFNHNAVTGMSMSFNGVGYDPGGAGEHSRCVHQ